jgi:hypothetical protein
MELEEKVEGEEGDCNNKKFFVLFFLKLILFLHIHKQIKFFKKKNKKKSCFLDLF